MGSVVWNAPGLTPPPVTKTALLDWVSWPLSTPSKALKDVNDPEDAQLGWDGVRGQFL